MPDDNVIPIIRRRRHPESVPAPDAGQRRFRWFVAGLGVIWAAALTAAVALTPFPSIWPLLALCVLVVAAEHRFILFGDETSMSSSIVVILCAVTFWHDDAYLVGPMLVASCGGLLFQHLRSRSWDLVCANGCIFSFSAAGASYAIRWIPDSPGTSAALLGACVAVVSYWFLNSLLTGFFSAIRTQCEVTSSVHLQLRSQIHLILIVVSAATIGVAAAGDSVQILILIAAPLFLMEMSSSTRERSRTPSAISLYAVTFLTVGLTAIAFASPSAALAALALAPLPLTATAIGWQSLGSAVPLVACVGFTQSHIGEPISKLAIWWLASAICITALRITPVVARALKKRYRLDCWVIIGLLAPSKLDVLVAAAAALLGLTLENISSSAVANLIGATVVVLCSATLNRQHFGRQETLSSGRPAR